MDLGCWLRASMLLLLVQDWKLFQACSNCKPCQSSELQDYLCVLLHVSCCAVQDFYLVIIRTPAETFGGGQLRGWQKLRATMMRVGESVVEDNTESVTKYVEHKSSTYVIMTMFTKDNAHAERCHATT